ncbi:MAG: tetratricopeptide repeat protein [bacterium]
MRLILSLIIITLMVTQAWAEENVSLKERLRAGIERYELRDYQGAISIWEKVAESDPAYCLAHYNLGLVYEALNQQDQAREAYLKSLRCNPDDIETLIRLGVIYYQRGDYSTAAQEFELARSLDQNCPDVYYWLGKVSLAQGNTQAAVTFWNEALNLKPDDKLLLKEKRQVQQGVANKEDAYFYYRQGRRHHYLHDFTSAVAAYRQGILIDPKLIEAHYWLGRAYLSLGDKKQAIKEWTLVLELHPNHTLAKKHIKEIRHK